MTSLGRWLVGILNAHIERDNVPPAEPAPDSPLSRFYIGQLEWPELPAAASVLDRIDSTRRHLATTADVVPVKVDLAGIPRPCWACGDPAGFYVFHLPCCRVAPWKPAAPWERVP